MGSEWKERLGEYATTWYILACALFMFGLCWAAVPLYQIFCQETGYGGTTQTHKDYAPPPESTSKAAKRLIEVDFAGTLGGALPWEFTPAQKKIVVAPGETALAFYSAKNLSDRPIIGVSIYHVMPPEMGIYFNKIQCFCFEEQLLNPGEEVDMPVFFFLDPDMVDDPRLDEVSNITLSYVFFESKSDIPPEYEMMLKAEPSSKPPPVVAA